MHFSALVYSNCTCCVIRATATLTHFHSIISRFGCALAHAVGMLLLWLCGCAIGTQFALFRCGDVSPDGTCTKMCPGTALHAQLTFVIEAPMVSVTIVPSCSSICGINSRCLGDFTNHSSVRCECISNEFWSPAGNGRSCICTHKYE